MNEDDLNNFIGEQLSSGVDPDALAASLMHASLTISTHCTGHKKAISISRTLINIYEKMHADEKSGAKPN